jgi:hypothetical protein
MHMVWLQMPFLYLAFFLACQIPKYSPKVSPKLGIQHFPAVFGYPWEHYLFVTAIEPVIVVVAKKAGQGSRAPVSYDQKPF